MKRLTVLLLTGLTLASGLADAARRSGGGFGGSRSSYRSAPPRSSTYRSPTPNAWPQSQYRSPRTTSPAAGSTTSSQSRSSVSRSSAAAQRKATLPSNAEVSRSPLNTAAAAKVTPAQINNWNKTVLPAGVPRSAVTYSASPSSQYQYQLQPGRYYPYPQSYYRQHGIGYDILKYALIFTAVQSVAHAVAPPPVIYPTNAPVMVQQSGPNLWNYVGMGFLAAAAAWFFMGRRR